MRTVEQTRTKTLIYVVDPMCSWCWGFSPVFEAIGQKFSERATLQIMMGGLRPGNAERFDEQRRAYILGHWHAVHTRTGQLFNFDFQMGPSFTYDTEPASRAVMVVRYLSPQGEAAMLKKIQEAFYVKNADVISETVLADLVGDLGLDRSQFLAKFQDPHMKHSVWEEFEQARQLGVSGFPTLLGRHGQTVSTLTHGYQAFDRLAPVVDEWIHSGLSE